MRNVQDDAVWRALAGATYGEDTHGAFTARFRVRPGPEGLPEEGSGSEVRQEEPGRKEEHRRRKIRLPGATGGMSLMKKGGSGSSSEAWPAGKNTYCNELGDPQRRKAKGREAKEKARQRNHDEDEDHHLHLHHGRRLRHAGVVRANKGLNFFYALDGGGIPTLRGSVAHDKPKRTYEPVNKKVLRPTHLAEYSVSSQCSSARGSERSGISVVSDSVRGGLGSAVAASASLGRSSVSRRWAMNPGYARATDKEAWAEAFWDGRELQAKSKAKNHPVVSLIG